MERAPSKTNEERNDQDRFIWRDLEPEWVRVLRADKQAEPLHTKDLVEKEKQMDTIAALAEEEGINFLDAKPEEGVNDFFIDAGVISTDKAENIKRKRESAANPLARMISWGEQNGIVTHKEANDLREWYELSV